MAKKRLSVPPAVDSAETLRAAIAAPDPSARPSLRSRISVFLSYPTPAFVAQQKFIERIQAFLEQRGFGPRTLGVTDYDMDAPLTAIRRLLHESNGLITIAFRRTYIEKGAMRHGTDIPTLVATPMKQQWLTSPWSHIEPAMAYQLGLPVLIFRQKGVVEDGILERGILGLYMPEFDLDKPLDDYMSSAEWNGIIGKWEGCVRAVVDRKGTPPKLF